MAKKEGHNIEEKFNKLYTDMDHVIRTTMPMATELG